MTYFRKKLDKDGNPILDAEGKEVLEEVPESEIATHANGGGNSRGSSSRDDVFPIESQEDLEKVIRRRLKSIEKSMREEAKTEAAQEAAVAEATKNGDYKKLYDDLKQKQDKIEAEKKEADHLELKKKVAKANGLPEDAAPRLVGDDEEALVKDAKAVVKMLGVQVIPDTDLGQSNNQKPRKPKGESEQEDYEKSNFWLQS